jgi:hypothetical protein
MARRHGSGAVKRRADGRWEGQLRLADGTRKYVYSRNRRELIARLQEERWRLACGMPLRARSLTLADYAEQWLEVMRSRLRPTTFAGYELCLGRAMRMLGSVRSTTSSDGRLLSVAEPETFAASGHRDSSPSPVGVANRPAVVALQGTGRRVPR